MDWKRLRYYGKYTACGTFAVLCTMKTKISPEIFELTTGVPFGIRCVNMKSQRLLTTFRDPNIGLDTAMLDWGIPYEKVESSSKRKIFEKLCWDMEQEERGIIIGPLNMGKLFYIPLCTVYEGVDHYIMVRKTGKEEVVLTDSEGYVAVPVTLKQLYKMWDIQGVYEAKGQYRYRIISEPEKKLLDEQIAVCVTKRMFDNIRDAEECGQGSKAFMEAYRIMQENNISRWRLCILHEVVHLRQRKHLTVTFINDYLEQTDNIIEVLAEQIFILSKIQRELEEEMMPEIEHFQNLGNLEKLLMNADRK